MAEHERYDVVVIGAGTAGSNAARTAHELGKSVAMVFDAASYQNLCIELGCMPSKSLLGSAHLGLTLEKALRRKDEHVKNFLTSLQSSQQEIGYDIIRGVAAFTAGGDLAVNTPQGGRLLTGTRYVIATGSENFVPPIPGLETVSYFTSDDVMRNKVTVLPKVLAVVGGGPIGLEMATFFAALGSEVHILERGKLLSPFDPEFGEELARAFGARGIHVHESASVERVSKNGESIQMHVKEKGEENELSVGALMIATGRHPKLDGLRLEHIDLSVEKGQLLNCSETMCTKNERVYAAGDVTRDIELLHIAAEEGRVAGWNAAGGEPVRAMDHEGLRMFVIFTDPPVAHVGMAEKDAKEKGRDIISVTTKLPETGRAITMGVEYGLWKMIADRESGKILGSTILGPRADDLIHEVYLAKQFGKTVSELAKVASHFGGYHPTLSEQFFNLIKELNARMQ